MIFYLVTRPEHDDTTYYLSNWCKDTIRLAEDKGIKVIDLNKEKANRKEFESRINKFSPRLVMFNGHGDENMVTGHKNQPLVIANNNEKLLKSKIIYALSCRSAKSLGLKSIEAGAESYTGYNDDFIFIYEPTKFSRPLLDETARLFLEPSKIFIESLIKGNTIKDAIERYKNTARKNFLKKISGNGEDIATAKYLWWNLKNFISHGNINAKVS